MRRVKLKDCCIIKPPKSEAKKLLTENESVSFVPMSNLGVNTQDLLLQEDRPFSEVSGSYTYFADNDVLLAKITPCFENGKLGIAKGLTNGIGFGSSEFIVFRANDELLAEYLYYFLMTPIFREQGKAVMSGAVGHRRVPKDFIENTEIPLPTLKEQKNIVATLDQALNDIEIARITVVKNIENTKELFDSYLNKVFLEKGIAWLQAKLSKHVKFIDYRGKTPIKLESGMRLITAKNVRMGFLRKEPEEFVSPDSYDDWMTRGIPQKGDVLFTTEAPLANVAQLDTDEKVVLAQRIITMQPDARILNSTFLKFALMSAPIQKKIHEKSTGATATGIKASLLKKIEIDFPDNLVEQKRIAETLVSLSQHVEALRKQYERKLYELESLKKSILQKAFTGELTKSKGVAA